MAPRGSRLIPITSPDTLNPATSSTRPTSPRRPLGPSQVTEADILQHAYGIPTLQTSPDRRPSHATHGGEKPSRHGRSRSHPFPSLFQSKKKRQEENNVAGSDLTDDEVPISGPSQPPVRVEDTKRPRVPEKDLMTGRCMTCDSMVRWPKELDVFRCTVCLTINDLNPINRETVYVGERKRGRPGTNRILPPEDQKPLSLDKTNSLIEECISSYLLDRLKSAENAPRTLNSPPTLSTREHTQAVLHDSLRIPEDNERSQEIPLREGRSAAAAGLNLEFQEPNITVMPYSRSTPGSYEYLGSEKRTLLSTGPAAAAESKEVSLDFVGDPEFVTASNNSQFNQSNEEARAIFKRLEEYIVASFTSHECINTSFASTRPRLGARAASEGVQQVPEHFIRGTKQPHENEILSTLDAKALLLGDIAENGLWWTGLRDTARPSRSRSHRKEASAEGSSGVTDSITVRSPKIDWTEAGEWYRTVINVGKGWRRYLDIILKDPDSNAVYGYPSIQTQNELEEHILEAQAHTRRVLLKATETLLKRPGGLLKAPEDIRFLLIILANPLLYPSPISSSMYGRNNSRSRSRDGHSLNPPRNLGIPPRNTTSASPASSQEATSGPGQHSGIIKRVLGLLSNLPNECHHHLVAWFARFSEGHFKHTAELIGGFITYRLTRQHGRKRGTLHDPSGGLIPSVAASGGSSAALHAALGLVGQSSKASDNMPKTVVYNDDWQIKAAARVMALLFSANNSGINRRHELKFSTSRETSRNVDAEARERAHRHGQILPTSDFYNTLLDYSDLVADFEAWEAKRGKFSFCQYPFFLSIWAKIQIMEYDARRQMEVKAREAFFDSIMSRKAVNQYLVLKVRRDCLVEDSLKGVSEVVGIGGEEIKKGLRIEFKGEEGIDAGGLRKEWFLLLVRDVFNPEHGMFTYDDESRVCYFNPNTFETSDQFFLVGVVLGLAIYNSTILDVALPPFAFRKLLAAGPTAPPSAPSHAKPTMTYSLDDLAEFRPSLANGLRQLLEYDGDVETIFCRDFVADVERYGQIIQVPLCPNGEKRPVTNANRREFVDLYVRYLLDTAVTRQFEPFKRGFFTVCGGNALSLFRPEEIELLIRGSDEPLDITSLQAVSVCENWGIPSPAEDEPVISWFWQSFRNAAPKDQRKLLSFITGSDRIPAMGAANLVIKLSCLGDDANRYPVARTCFNMLSLYRYESRIQLESMLWRAVNESEGFGLK